jgi:hypothetical protein
MDISTLTIPAETIETEDLRYPKYRRYDIGSLPVKNGFVVAMVEREFGEYVKFSDIDKKP